MTSRTAGLSAFLSLIPATVALAAEPAAPPNIILIIADDLGAEDLGCFGHPSIRTPRLDSLAREGLRFDRAFLTCSSCSPSRSSIITGRYPHGTGAEELHQPLPAAQTTFVELLRKAGYWTAAAGKWHLGEAIKDRFDVVHEANPAGFRLPQGATAKGGPLGGEIRGDRASGCDRWVPTLRDRPKGRPFFLWLAAVDPHRDYQPDITPRVHRPEDAVVPPYLPDTPPVREDFARYADEISRLDRFVGAVLDELKLQEIDQQTLILFLSDNGRPFPRCKTTLYDSGIRTPWIVRWPGRVAAGGRSTRLVSSVDIAPTFLSLAAITPVPTMRGSDLSPLFKDPTTKIHDLVFAERNWHDYEARGRAARSERFKYIRNEDHERPLTPPADAVRSPTFRTMRELRDQGRLTPAQRACFVHPRPAEELYDLAADPQELHNLAGEARFDVVLQAMRRSLDEWARRTQDRPPAALSPDEFDRETGEPLPNRNRERTRRPPRTPVAR